jgi:hypothetical protein
MFLRSPDFVKNVTKTGNSHKDLITFIVLVFNNTAVVAFVSKITSSSTCFYYLCYHVCDATIIIEFLVTNGTFVTSNTNISRVIVAAMI